MQHTPHDSSPAAGLKFEGQSIDAARTDDYDALADLFLGDEPARITTQTIKMPHAIGSEPARAAAPRVEALVLGHLPVRGSAWTGQYAASIAQSTGNPVALIRLGIDHATISLVGGAAKADTPVELTSLESALASAGQLAPNWIIHTDELAETELAHMRGIDRMTLLVGTNEASIVATYRAIKGFATAGGSEPPAIGIAVVGVPIEDAKRVRDRIERASQVFLSQPIELVAAIPRVGPTGAVVIFDGPAKSDLPSVLEQLDRGLRTGAPSAMPYVSQPEPQRPAKRPIKSSPAPIDASTATAPLTTHIPELHAIEARCPDDINTEIAVDRSGGLHILCDESTGYERLVATLSWAQTHAKLLALTSRDVPMVDPGLLPVGHLFTSAPKGVRHLLDADIRLHLRAQVRTDDGATSWFCTELN